MELIRTDETDERVCITRPTDSIRAKDEHYTFEKNDGQTGELVGFQDDGNASHIPPKIPDPVKNELEERLDIEIEVAPIYPLECPDCGRCASKRIEVEEDERGYEQPVNDKETAECVLCDEEKEMKVLSQGLIQGGY